VRLVRQDVRPHQSGPKAALSRIGRASNAELNNEQIENENLQLVARRFRETLRPGSKALEALAELVKDTGEIEALARELYYESRPHEDIGKTLKARVEAILRTT
ncbi:hypothetical protein, partial [Bradyrhizobium liaoningense]|uniref:hypothetical protein n=1 Tax=Bradyrhizobium liaoningense TaxID=43992 RepID=UPI001BA916A7